VFASTVPYSFDGQQMLGYLTYDNSITEKRPAVLIAHAWRGQDDFARQKADEFASKGYVAFAMDVFGDCKNATTDEESLELMLPLFKERKLLQERAKAALAVVCEVPYTDSQRVGVIGFCFGGLTALELLRSVAEVRCIVCCHAVLADQLGDVKAIRTPNKPKLSGSALFLHGNDDPMVSSHNIQSTQEELDEADVDWQFHTFGKTLHAFTNPQANDAEKGLLYSPLASARSWHAINHFFTEQFNSTKESQL